MAQQRAQAQQQQQAQQRKSGLVPALPRALLLDGAYRPLAVVSWQRAVRSLLATL